ncbi:MAG: AEC family transporter, partial [Coriobacteriia bacterium]|nr:AEC family transporter [Coriobacteriia bacterium]
MTSGTVMSTVLVFVGIVLLGALLRAFRVLKAEDTRPINAIIVYVCLPAFIFRAIHGVSLNSDLWIVVAVAWAVFAVMLALAWLASRLLRLPRKQAGAFMIAAALGNTGYIGYPLTEALLGKDQLPEAVFYDVFGTVAALVLVGFLVAQRFGQEEGKRGRINVLREFLSFPAVIALAVGLVMRGVWIPTPVSNGLELLGTMVAPLVMLSVGLSLSAHVFGRMLRPLSVLAVMRLLVAPAIALGIGALVFAADGPARVTVLEAGMPTMMLTLVVGERFGLDTDFLASAILVTTAGAAVTL